MKKEAKLLLGRGLDALILAIDHFNRAWEGGRPEAVLIQLDRSFEMLLKAAIVHQGGRAKAVFVQETTKTGRIDTLYVRVGNSTKALTVKEALAYAEDHWSV